MKIGYILEVDPFTNSGIIKKVNAQVGFWRLSGHETKIYVIWPKSKEKKKSYLSGCQIHFSYTDRLPEGFIKTYFNKILSARKVLKKLKEDRPDMLYIRQNIWYPGLTSILKKYPSILEINSVDSFEFKYYSSLKRVIYFFGKKKILNHIDAIVAVSPDILEHYKHLEIPSCVVSNGIDFQKFKTFSTKPKGKVNMVFVGSGNMAWHGVGKVLELAKLLHQFHFKIVGYYKEDFPTLSLENVTFFGWVEKKELEKIYASSHFGIGSFGNYLVGKKIDSTLKVREYLAYGLPVILGHIDVDFHDSKFVKKVTDETNGFLDVEMIVGFIEDYKSHIVSHKEIEKIKSEKKEMERLTFFESIIGRIQND